MSAIRSMKTGWSAAHIWAAFSLCCCVPMEGSTRAAGRPELSVWDKVTYINSHMLGTDGGTRATRVPGDNALRRSAQSP